jgi:hemerythrin-like metal-binding protein
MALLDWKNEYSINNKIIDEQHKKLVDLINQLHAAMSEGKGKDILGKILEELVSYTVFHFSSEEKFMKEHNYSGYSLHKIEHDKLTKQVVEFQDNYKAGKSMVSQELLKFLKDWLVNHIIGSDKKLASLSVANAV